MRRLKVLKNSAFIIDALLIAGALIAIIGLATYVRLKATNKPGQSKSTEDLAYTIQKFDLLTEDVSAEGAPNNSNTVDSSAVLDAHTSLPDDQSLPSQLPAPGMVPSTVPPTRIRCDRQKYDEVTRSYQAAVEPLQKSLDELLGTTRLTRLLQAKINDLNNQIDALTTDYNNHPDVINCSKDM